jgi:GT2 family glycosyltransferase
MKLSFVIPTRNSGPAIGNCIGSIVAALAVAGLSDAEIIIIDNGSSDDTVAVVRGRALASPVKVTLLSEPQPGRARAFNRGAAASAGTLIASIDDDCTLHRDHVRDMLRHDAVDTRPVLRGGRVELGDPTDLPYTITKRTAPIRMNRAMRSTRHGNIMGTIAGCNMVMQRALYERLGPFDENFGPGSRIGSGDDGDYVIRAYLHGFDIEYVPDMRVKHFHGRKTEAAIQALFRRYAIGTGGLIAKHMWRHPDFCRLYLWDLRSAAKEAFCGGNTFLPAIGFSHRDKVKYLSIGAVAYLVGFRTDAAGRRWDAERKRACRSASMVGGTVR